MQRLPLSVTIIAFNEEKNIARALESVRHWVEEVLVVDSGSTDRTVEIAQSLGARTLSHPWTGYGQQKNFAQAQARFDWVLSLDADEVISPQLADEIQGIFQCGTGETRGFLIPRLSWYLGRWIRHGGWYPNRLVRLADRRTACWSEPEVHEEWVVTGPVAVLTNDLLHYPFAGIREQVETNLTFSNLGSLSLRRHGVRKSLFLLLAKPVGKFIETYLLKKGFLDGIAGFIISVNAAHSIFLKYAYLFEDRP